jgi:hypothetical protein
MRSTMSQKRLNDLAILCIEKKLLDEIDIDTLVTNFASKMLEETFEIIYIDCTILMFCDTICS